MNRLKILIVLLFIGLSACAQGELPMDDIDLSFEEIEAPDASETHDPDLADVSDTQPDGSVLGDPCDPFLQDCGVGKCVVGPEGDATCLPNVESRTRGQECETIAQCEVGTQCVSVTQDPQPRCRDICSTEENIECPEGLSCRSNLRNAPEIGICIGPPPACDIYEQNCDFDQDCIVQDLGDLGIGTYCGTAGARQSGQPCEEDSGACTASLICVRAAGETSATCQPVCRETGPTCETPLECTGFAQASGVTFCQ